MLSEDARSIKLYGSAVEANSTAKACQTIYRYEILHYIATAREFPRTILKRQVIFRPPSHPTNATRLEQREGLELSQLVLFNISRLRNKKENPIYVSEGASWNGLAEICATILTQVSLLASGSTNMRWVAVR